MQEHGFLPDFSKAGLHELESAHQAGWQAQFSRKDLRHMLWASIDNDDSLDLDQLTVTEALPNKQVKLLVAIADVDAIVKKDSAIDEHARLWRRGISISRRPTKIFKEEAQRRGLFASPAAL